MRELYRKYLNSYQGLSHAAWMLALVMLINRTGAMVLPFLGIYMANQLGFDLAEVGIVLAFFGFGAMVGSWLGGWLTDRFGNFWVQALSLLFSIPLFLIIPAFKTVEELAAIIFLLSVITESFRPANSVAVARYANPEHITRAFSLNRMAINLGFSIGPAVGGILATISYNWIFYGNALGAFCAAMVFIAFFYSKKPKNQQIERQLLPEAGEEKPRSPYRDWKFHLFNLCCLLYAICFFQILSTLPLFYQNGHGLNEKQIGMLLAFNGIVVVIFEMFLVHIAERRLNYASSIAIGTILSMLSFVILPIPGGILILFVSMFILSISEILVLPFTSSVVVKRSHRLNQGAYMGLNSLAFSAAHVVSPFLGTRIAAGWGFNPLWLGTSAILMLMSFAFYFLIKRM